MKKIFDEYRNNKLRKQLGNATENQRAFGTMAKSVTARLDDIRAAPTIRQNTHALFVNRLLLLRISIALSTSGIKL